MNENNSLVLLTNATRMLAECRTINDAKKIADMALAAKVYAKKAQLGDEAIRYANEIRVEALKLLGDMLKQTERAKGADKGGRQKIDGSRELPSNPPPTLADMGLTKKESSAAQSLSTLAEKKPDVFAEAKQSGKSVSEILKPAPHVSNNSGENEWYTPPEFIESARLVMGGIDTDPASSKKANEAIRAKKYFDIDDDGRTKKWGGNIWLNPPYGHPLVSEFCELLTYKYKSGEINQACIIVNNGTETAWFQSMLSACRCACFIKGRVRFIDQSGTPALSPLQGQVILYFGDRFAEFSKEFSRYGAVLWNKA